MSEKQKAIDALTLVLESSKAALAFLADPTQSADPSLDASPLSVIHKDFLSLLSLIYASTTKLSLVLKPSSPSYTAALGPLRELSERVASLPHCVRLLQTDHGKSLAAEAYTIARDVLVALQSLVQALIVIGSENSASSGDVGEYLVKTGTVHDIIEDARGSSGFSGNNLVAVRKIWKHNQDSLQDSLEEVREAMEKAEDLEGGSEGEEFDDGWGELGMPSSVKPSAAELETIKKIYTIARLSTLLHQRIWKDALSTLTPSLPLSKETNTILDNLADASSDLVSSSDNFISTIYPPQVVEDISIELQGFRRQLTVLQSKIEPLIPERSIEEQLSNLQLSNTAKSSDHYTKLRKWYIACINQINKNIQELEYELKGQEQPPLV
ncbi:hypothetical protein D9756_001573 [Leucocoprinus leucothites]|uniref:Cyclin-D1-binding protein 1-like N-terminal domain-containing protein n=1 Tax=Leucocoprinus leucothites TaxID=201217 RepID=A0A8H5LI25_9AGAR|nr:hypothetical protein D9756_001573 [Leucoagaricus leucothites]